MDSVSVGSQRLASFRSVNVNVHLSARSQFSPGVGLAPSRIPCGKRVFLFRHHDRFSPIARNICDAVFVVSVATRKLIEILPCSPLIGSVARSSPSPIAIGAPSGIDKSSSSTNPTTTTTTNTAKRRRRLRQLPPNITAADRRRRPLPLKATSLSPTPNVADQDNKTTAPSPYRTHRVCRLTRRLRRSSRHLSGHYDRAVAYVVAEVLHSDHRLHPLSLCRATLHARTTRTRLHQATGS